MESCHKGIWAKFALVESLGEGEGLSRRITVYFEIDYIVTKYIQQLNSPGISPDGLSL